MKINELLLNIKKEDFNIAKELDIKKYLPIMEKKKLAIGVVTACTNDIDDYLIVDRFKTDIYFHMSLLKVYTNLEISEDFDEMVAQYDMLCRQGILNEIIGIISDDYDVMSRVLEYEISALLEENSVEYQVVRMANKVTGIIDVASDKLKTIDVNKILPKDMDISPLLKMFNIMK